MVLTAALFTGTGCDGGSSGISDATNGAGRQYAGLSPGAGVGAGPGSGLNGPSNPGPGTGQPVDFLPGGPPTTTPTPTPTPPPPTEPGNRYFVTARTGQEVGVFNADTFVREDTVSLGDSAAGADLDPVNGDLYVSLVGSGNVAVLDTANLSATPALFPSGGVGGIGPLDIVYNQDRVFVTNHTSSTVRGVDATTLTPFGTGPVPQATEVAVDNTHDRVYVTSNTFSTPQSRLFVFDSDLGGTPTVINTGVVGGETADGLAYDEQNGAIYVGNDSGGGSGDYFVILDAGDLAAPPIDVLAPGSRITSIAVDNEHDRLYVCCLGSNLVAIYDTSGGAFNPVPLAGSPTVTTGSGPIHVTYEPGRDRLLAVNQASNNVSVFDVSSGTPQLVTGTPFAVGGNPYVIVPDTTQN